jgi:hypothetical protein
VIALAVALGLCVPVIVALAWAIVALYREGQRSRASVGEAVQNALVVAAEAHAKETAALHEFYRASLTAVGSTREYGTPTPAPASIDYEPTPEQALGRAIDEDMVARGVESLRAEFQSQGIVVTDAELRDQVLAIVLGQPIPEPGSIAGLIDQPVHLT